MDLYQIREKCKIVGTEFLAVADAAGHPAGWEAVHHGLAEIGRALGLAEAEDRDVREKARRAVMRVDVLASELESEKALHAGADERCEYALAELVRVRAENQSLRAEIAALRDDAERDRARLADIDVCRYETVKGLRKECDDLRAAIGELDEDNESLRAENAAFREAAELRRLNAEIVTGSAAELRRLNAEIVTGSAAELRHAAVSLSDVFAALPSGSRVTFEGPGWDGGGPTEG